MELHRVNRMDYILFNLLPQLLDFVNDGFIGDILPGLTQYIDLARRPEYVKNAV